MSKQTQQGFTLIELIVVIVILGILAAVAIPKFVDFGRDARIANIQATAGAVQAAASMGYGMAQLRGHSTTGALTVTGLGPVHFTYKWPTANSIGIGAMLVDPDKTKWQNWDTATTMIYQLQAGCTVTYTSAPNTTIPASVNTNLDGC